MDHEAVDDIAVPDEVGNKGVFRFIVDVFRRADLLDIALVHDDDRVGHAQGLFLVVGDEDEGNAQFLFDLDEFQLHTAPQFAVQGAQRFVQEQDPRLIDDGPGDGHALLLAAGQVDDVGMFIAVEVDQFQGIADLVADIIAGLAVDFRTEGDIFGDVHMGKKRIILEHRIDLAPVRRQLGDIGSLKEDAPFIRRLKTGDEAERRRLAAAAGAEEGDKFIFRNRQVQAV